MERDDEVRQRPDLTGLQREHLVEPRGHPRVNRVLGPLLVAFVLWQAVSRLAGGDLVLGVLFALGAVAAARECYLVFQPPRTLLDEEGIRVRHRGVLPPWSSRIPWADVVGVHAHGRWEDHSSVRLSSGKVVALPGLRPEAAQRLASQ